MKRKDFILNRLNNLNIKSIQEGLLQLLDYRDFNIVNKRRCITMILFLPNVEGFDSAAKTEVSDVVNTLPNTIMETAIEFCNEHSIDSTLCKVFVNNIDFKTKQHELWDFFEHFGKVLRVHLVKDRKTKRSRGFGFVVFSSPFDAKKALSAKKYELTLNGRLLQVLPAVKKKKNTNYTPDDPEKANQKLKDAADYFMCNNLNEKSEENIGVTGEEKACTLIDKVCDDLLLEIFSYMDLCSRIRLELVCKRWHNVAIRSWAQVTHLHFKNVFNLNHTHASLTDRILLSILRKGCENLKSIDLSASPYLISHTSLIKVASVCQKLEEINVSYVPLKNKSVKELGKCLNLKKIHMTNCLNVGEKGFWWLFKDQVRLEELIVTDTSRLNGKCIYMLPPTVKYIDFNRCSELADIGLINMVKRCPSITYLDLSFCVSITNNGLNILFEKCYNIIELKLKGLGGNISSTGLMYITRLTKLTGLDISRNIAVTDEVIQTIALICVNLETLNIEACHGDISSNGINTLCFCKNLRELNASYIVPVSDECITELAMEGNLRKLVLRTCPEISDKCAAQCVQYLDNLEVLDLSGCFYVTDEFPCNLDINTINMSRSNKLEIILGGTQVSEEGIAMLQEKLKFSIVTMQNFQVGMLRNDRDPTLVRPLFPESSSEEDSEDELKPDLIVLKPDIELDIKQEYPCVDEDGERLWVVQPNPESQNLINYSKPEDDAPSQEIIALEITPVKDESVKQDDDENWDDEMEEGCVWMLPAEHLELVDVFHGNMCDEFLENDDRSRYELIG